jgi:hypothetical protein
MDIQDSFRLILERRQAVTHRFFSVALGGGHEARLVAGTVDGTGPSAEFSGLPQAWSAPLAIYAQFTNDLLRTLREFHGADWNPQLREQWRVAIERVGHGLFAACRESFRG